MKLRLLFFMFCFALLSACTVNSAGDSVPASKKHHVVATGTYSPYMSSSEPALYAPAGFYSPGYQYRYQTAKGWWNQ
jgi:hypothetical protein